MKVRTGFVSNSSSASFVVKYRDADKKKNDMDFLWSEINSLIVYHLNNHGDNNDVETRKEQIYEKLFQYDSESEFKKELDRQYEKLKEGENIAYIQIDMHAPIIQEIIKNSKHIKIIKNWSD